MKIVLGKLGGQLHLLGVVSLSGEWPRLEQRPPPREPKRSRSLQGKMGPIFDSAAVHQIAA